MKPLLNITPKRHWIYMLVLLTVTLITAPSALAAPGDTDAGIQISNTARVNYSVGPAPAIFEDSNTVDFLVDHKVRPYINNPAVGAIAVPGGSLSYLTFVVLNDGNTKAADTLAIRLTGLADPGSDFPITDIKIYQESNSIAGFQNPDGGGPGPHDTLVTDHSVPSLGTISLGRDLSDTIYVTATMDGGALTTETGSVHLIATAWDTAGVNVGAVLDEDNLGADLSGDDADTEEVVFADDASIVPLPGPIGPDVAFDGMHSEVAVFTIGTATIGANKTSTVVADPFGGTYRVPGAYVQYQVTITNTGSASATLTTVTDPVPTNTTLDPNLSTDSAGTAESGTNGNAFKVVVSNSQRAEDGNNQYFTDAIDADGVDLVAGVVTAAMNTILPAEATGPGYTAGELKPGEIVTITFNVMID